MFNLNKKNIIGANPSPVSEKPEFPKRESQLPLPKNNIPMPECKQHNKSNNILEKNVKFNNKYWLVRIEGCLVQVYLADEPNKVSGNQIYDSSCYGDTLIEVCKNAILRANDIIAKSHDYENFQKWNGNMDEELNNDDLIFVQDVDKEELNYMNELNILSKIESKTFNDELRIKWIQDYFTNKLMTRLQRL